MDEPIQITFQGNTLTLFLVQFHWKSLTIDTWQPESISWFGAGVGFNRHAPQTKQQSPPWCDYAYYSVIATSWSGIHSVIKKYSRITHRLCMKLLGEGEEHKRRFSNIFSWLGWMTAPGGILYSRGSWLIHCVYLKENGDMEYSRVFLKILFEGRINWYKI